MSYILDFTINLGSSQTGLILAAQLLDSDGLNVGSGITTGFSEIGTGTYLWSGTIPDDHQGAVKFYETGQSGVLALSSINPQYLEPVPESYPELGATPTWGQHLWLMAADRLLPDLDDQVLRLRDTSGNIIATFSITLNDEDFPIKRERIS